MASVCVAVRVRPRDERTKKPSSNVVQVKTNTIRIYKPKGQSNRGDERKIFSFDFSYDSTDPHSASFASQEKIYKDLGAGVIKAAFEGFNACIFAYGQTGSGKSYTMMGRSGDEGLIPRICKGLFQQVSDKSAVSFNIEVSYLEIYNERVHDLLQKSSTSPDNGRLRVREHPKEGPYVQNLSRHTVQSYCEVEELTLLGNGNRMTASTEMNDMSSRSHAIFTIRFTQAWFEEELPCETVSKIHLVDLAGSERADATRATGARLKEGANINKSLVTLGCVISTLAISPADVNYGETLSTLHYASRAKNIVNSPKVNEDKSVKVIRGLQAEIARLRKQLEEANQIPKGELSSSTEVKEKLHENEAKVEALTTEWASKWRETHGILKEETVALWKRRSGVVLDCQLPHLIGIDNDLLESGIILYYLKEGQTTIGSNEALCGQDIVLHGPGVLGEHCVMKNQDGTVTFIPEDGALCLVNGFVITTPCQLTQGSILQLGNSVTFRFNQPTEAALLREKQQTGLLSAVSLSLTDVSRSAENLPKVMLQKPRMMEEKCSHRRQQELQWQQVERKLSKCSDDVKGFLSENSGDPHQSKTKESRGAQTKETGTGSVNMDEESSELRPATRATPGKSAVPNSTWERDKEALQGGASTRDSPEQERDWCHKSGPELTSEGPRRRAWRGPENAGCAGEVWSGDASLQHTSVPGRVDGCGTRPGGNANEIQEVMADCYEGRPSSGGNSLSSVSHLQRTEGRKHVSVPLQTSTHSQFDKTPLSSQAVSCPTKEPTTWDQSYCREMDELRGMEEVLRVRAKLTPALGLRSLVNTISGIVQGASQQILNSSFGLPQVLQHSFGVCWSCPMVSLIRNSRVLSVLKESKVISLVKDSYITSLFSDTQILSFLKDLPLVQQIHLEMTQHFYTVSTTKKLDCTNDNDNLDDKTPKEDTEPICKHDVSICSLPQTQDTAENIKAERMAQSCPETEDNCCHEYKTQREDITLAVCSKDLQIIFSQSLVYFPKLMSKLQTSLSDLEASLESVLPKSLYTSQKVALFWLKAAKASKPKATPALVVVMESSVYTLTENCGALEVFYLFPLVQLKEVQIGFAGNSVCLIGPTKEHVLGLYTFDQTLTKELCGAVLALIFPGDSRVSLHPLLHGDLMELSLKWQAPVPDMLLDAGLRVCCHFQKSLANLIYLIHCNTTQEQSCLGEERLLLYCSVGICFPSHSKALGQLFVTDTHLGLVQEDIVFHPVGSVSTEACRLHFHCLGVRQLCDVRGVVVRDEDERGAVIVDVILANVKARGHPESVSEPCVHSHAEVWKLTFSCSTEAARLINHLSNV